MRHRKSGWNHHKCTPKKNQGGSTKVFIPNQRAKQAKARHKACNEETPRPPIQDIFGTTNGIKQPPTDFPSIEHSQGDGSWRAQRYNTPHCSQLLGTTILHTGMGF